MITLRILGVTRCQQILASKMTTDQALSLVSARHYHRALWLPETSDHPKLRVTYATTSNFDDTSLPVVLFIGPMFNSRYFAVCFDKLARDCGVRLVCPDRPGIGGSTGVPLRLRVDIWLETVPVLCEELGVTHLSLISHSAGTIYNLNTILCHRRLLDPLRPLAIFLAPYVPFGSSGARLPTMLSVLPSKLLDSWAGLNAFINTKIVSTATWSGGLLSSASSLVSTSIENEALTSETPLTSAVDRLCTTYRLAEGIDGANDEAKLCLRKCESSAWGHAEDYDACIKRIMEGEDSRQDQHPKLAVNAFFAESDIMSGQQGQEFFEKCWVQPARATSSVRFSTKTISEVNHDSILIDQERGALAQALRLVGKPDGPET